MKNYHFPNREAIQAIEVDALALDCFGRMRRVVRVSAKREDVHGRLFCYYVTDAGGGCNISMAQKQDEITRHACMRENEKEVREAEAQLRAVRLDMKKI